MYEDNTELLEKFYKDISLNLNEISNMLEIMSPTDVQLGDTNEYDTKFKVGNYEYIFRVTPSNTEDGKRIFHFKFLLLSGEKQPKRSQYKTDAEFKSAEYVYQTSITKTGNSIPTINKVFSIAHQYIKKYQPDYITFDANEESRKTLYDKLIRRALQYFPNYEKLTINPYTNSELCDGEYLLRKTN